MKKTLLFFTVFFVYSCFSSDYSALKCDNIGMIPTLKYEKNSGVSDSRNQRAVSVLDELRETVIKYPKLNLEQKKELFSDLSIGLKNNFQNPEIGSGNIVLFAALSKMRNYMIADMLQGKENYAFILEISIEKNVQLTKEQIISLVSKDFKIDDQNKDFLQSQIILAIISNLRDQKTAELYPYAKYIVSPKESAYNFKNFYQLLEDADIKNILQIYSMTEIENAIVYSALSLQGMQEPKPKTLNTIYMSFRNNMNPLQIEIFEFSNSEYKIGSPQRYIILDIKNLAENFLKSTSGIPMDLKFGLKIEK